MRSDVVEAIETLSAAYYFASESGERDELMRVVKAVPVLLLVLVISSACVFGGDDDDDVAATATTSLPTPTETTVATVPVSTATPQLTAEPTATAVPDDTYVVQAGDYLGLIADRFGTTVDEILALNDIVDPDVIEVGQILKIPPTAGSN